VCFCADKRKDRDDRAATLPHLVQLATGYVDPGEAGEVEKWRVLDRLFSLSEPQD